MIDMCGDVSSPRRRLYEREKDKDKGIEGKKDAIAGGDTYWVQVRVAGRKVSEKFLEEKENEVRLRPLFCRFLQ